MYEGRNIGPGLQRRKQQSCRHVPPHLATQGLAPPPPLLSLSLSLRVCVCVCVCVCVSVCVCVALSLSVLLHGPLSLSFSFPYLCLGVDVLEWPLAGVSLALQVSA
jgi:hypothetical protein